MVSASLVSLESVSLAVESKQFMASILEVHSSTTKMSTLAWRLMMLSTRK